MTEAVREMVEAMDAVLGPAGFARRKAVWNRRSDRLVDVVDLQVSKAGDSVTLNCGVFDPVVHAKTWGRDVPSHVQEPDCAVRARIGELLSGRDIWWTFGDSSQAAAELSSLTRSTVLPFLDEMHDPDAFDEFLARKVQGKRYPDLATQVYRAVRMSERGNRDAAGKLLHEVGEASSAWRERAEQVAAMLFAGPGA